MWRLQGDAWVNHHEAPFCSSDYYDLDARDGHVWVAGTDCSAHFDGTTWTAHDLDVSLSTLVAVPDGRVYGHTPAADEAFTFDTVWSLADARDQWVRAIAGGAVHVYFGTRHRAVLRRAYTAR